MKRCLTVTVTVALCAVMLISCGFDSGVRPAAVLHGEGAEGYIPCSADVLTASVTSGQAFVYDVSAEEYLYKKGEDMILYPASTTKLLSVLTALQVLKPEEVVTVGEEVNAVGEGSSVAYVRPGHELTVEMLVEAMLLPSGNDAAYALATAAGRAFAKDESLGYREAIAVFVTEMNEYARNLGACGSVFTCPDGYFTEEHHSTVEDMTLIARRALEEPLIMKYAGLVGDDVTYHSGEINRWENTNLFLHFDSIYYNPAVTGLKTGSTGMHDYSVIVSVDVGEKTYIVGVFLAPDKKTRFTDAQKLISLLGETP